MRTRILLAAATALTMAFTGCSDMMDVSSDRVVYEEDHQLNNPNDSIYSVIGVLAKMQDIADPCLIFGELRGDLMTVDAQNASTDLQQIAGFNATSANKYASKRDFYEVINNCNYVIAHMDTSIVVDIRKVMVPEYAQVKTLRAWTYLQLALIYGKVNYFTKPLLSTDDLDVAQNTMGIDELTQTLIADLKPVADVRALDYGSVDGWSSSEFFIPTKMLLGDLYLYNNQYAEAAQAYYDLIKQRGITVSASYANTWENVTRTSLNANHLTAYRNEVVTRMVFDHALRGNHSQLLKLTYSEKPSLLPVQTFVTEMAQRNHFHTDGTIITRYFYGDLRGCPEYGNGKTQPDAYGNVEVEGASRRLLITKFYNNLDGSETDALENRPLSSLAIVRPSTLYLRYAEAINRLGKPTTAFAVLKYGLSRTTLADTLKVDSNEVKDNLPYMDFSDAAFNSNVGTAARGMGLGVQFDRSQYVIPADADTTDYVEQAILQEMAAETCFEGNRFFDLLCVSRHRAGHPAFMAEKVAAKYADTAAMKSRLMNLDEWFVK